MEAKVTITGKLRVRSYDENNKLIEDWTGKNLVVNGGLANVCGLLAGDGGLGFPIDTYKAGTNGTAPALGNVAITAPFTKLITGYSYPTPSAVNFNFTMELSENNGMTIQEYGLFDANGTMFSRITKPATVKTNSLRIVGDWTFTYSN